MTKQKLERERQRLIETYDDVIVMQYFDRKTRKHVANIHLSQVTLSCRADITNLERHLMDYKAPQKLYLEVTH